MNAKLKAAFVKRWNTCKSASVTHPYVMWVSGVSASDDCKVLNGMKWAITSAEFEQIATTHINRKDALCGCRISPLTKLS